MKTSFLTVLKRSLVGLFKIPHAPWKDADAVLDGNLLHETLWDDERGSDEKRRAIRIAATLPVLYRAVSLIDQKEWANAKTQDISEVGVRLSTKQPLHVGSVLELYIQLPDTPKHTRVKGFVIWVRPDLDQPAADGPTFIMGIAFQNLKQVAGRGKIFSAMANFLCRKAMEENGEQIAKPAETLDEIKVACNLLYKEYLRRGYCEKNDLEMHYNHYIALPDSQIFVLKKSEDVVGTITVIPDTPAFGLPMEAIFSKELYALRKLGVRMGEVGLLALDGEMFGRKKFSMTDFGKYRALFSLYRVMMHYSYRGAQLTDFVIAVHPRHIELYQYLQFKQIGKEKIYSDGKPAIPMKMNLKDFYEHADKGPLGPYFRNVSDSPRYIWTADTVKHFLMDQKNLWEHLPDDSRQYLVSQYPGIQTPHP